MDKPTETKALALPKITPFERRALHMGADPATIYTADDLERYLYIKAQEGADIPFSELPKQLQERYEGIKVQEEADRAEK